MIKTFKDIQGDITESCDVCVIGSGAGGAVAAKELAERGRSVVLLEEGGHYTKAEWDGRPLPGLMKMYRHGGTTGTLGNPFISLTMGRCIGGSTTVNSATCFRTPESVLSKWRGELGLPGMSEDALAPHYERVEKTINVTELPWEVLGKNAEIVKRGCDALGLHCRPLKHNVKDCRGCGPCQFGCTEGAKQSMDVTYIPLAGRHGARIYANCRADRVIVEKGAVAGVSAWVLDPASGRRTHRMTVRARAVVAACGAMITPALLRASGLSNKNIGRHLQVHPGGRVVALMNEKVEGWKGVSQGAYVDDFEHEGITLEGVFVHPSLMLAALPGIGVDHKLMASGYNNLAAFGVMAHDVTTGRIHRTVPLFGRRRVTATYFIRKEDTDRLKRGIGYTAKIFFAAGAERVYTAISSMPVLHSMEDAERLLKKRIRRNQIETMAFHPLGSSRMAGSARLGALTPEGESWEVKNLYVADGATIPTSLGVNPQLTIMAVADMIAGNIHERLGKN